MKATSKQTYFKEMEFITMQMEVFIQDNGSRAKKKVLANIFLMMDLFYKASLIMISSSNEFNKSN